MAKPKAYLKGYLSENILCFAIKRLSTDAINRAFIGHFLWVIECPYTN